MKHAVLGALLLVALGGCEHHHVPQWPTPGQSAIQRALAATVVIETGGGLCAGYWADAATVVTAAHCVDGPGVPHVSSGTEAAIPFEVAHFDPEQDLAVLTPLLSIDYGHEWLPLASYPPAAGDAVLIIGHPGRYRYSVAHGNVSYPKRRIDEDEWGVHGDFCQINAGIWFGNSGGPAIDASGDVIGVASFFVENPSAIAFFVHRDAIRAALR